MKKTSAFLTGSLPPQSAAFDILYLLFRLHVGLSIAIGAGFSKVFHKINEKGADNWDNLAFGVPDWFVKQVGEIGFTCISPAFWAHLAVYGEFIGGLLIALGLLTRLSALQLAFQFFVISYLWYDEPAPLVGMYYQQLYFFAFLMVVAVGDGRFSLAALLKGGRRLPRPATAVLLLGLAGLLPAGVQAQAAGNGRVSFTVTNASLKAKTLDFKHFNGQTKKKAGYGYGLNALGSHAVNLPAPVRVYVEEGGKMRLLLVVRAEDDGRSFSVTKDYAISREDYLEAANQELNEQTDALEEAGREDHIARTAREKGLKMVTFRVKGSSLLPMTVHVRVQLPWDTKKSQHGFTTAMSRFSEKKMRCPVGAKVYLCGGPYWKAGADYPEKLIVTVDEEKENYLYSL